MSDITQVEVTICTPVLMQNLAETDDWLLICPWKKASPGARASM